MTTIFRVRQERTQRAQSQIPQARQRDGGVRRGHSWHPLRQSGAGANNAAAVRDRARLAEEEHHGGHYDNGAAHQKQSGAGASSMGLSRSSPDIYY